MPAGTLTLTNNSTTVSGSGTSFTGEAIKAGDSIVVTIGQVVYTVLVASVASNTSLALSQRFQGPTSGGLAWQVVPWNTMMQISSQMYALVSYNQRAHNLARTNWEKVLTTNGPVQIVAPDGSTVNGIGWPALDASKANKTDLDAKANKTDLDALALKTNTIEGYLGGIGTIHAAQAPANANQLVNNGFFSGPGDEGVNYASAYSPLINMSRNSRKFQLQGLFTGILAWRATNDMVTWTNWLYGCGRTVDGINSDIVAMDSINAPGQSTASVPRSGLRSTMSVGAQSDSFYKPFNIQVARTGNATNNWTFHTSFGFLNGVDGAASDSGPAICCTDGSSYSRYWNFNNGNSSIVTRAGTISPVASDIRVKRDVEDIDEEDAIEFVKQLRTKRFKFKNDPGIQRVGFIAQDVERLKPELVQTVPLLDSETEETYEDGKVLDAGEVAAAYLTPVVQYLLRKVEELETKLAAQESSS